MPQIPEGWLLGTGNTRMVYRFKGTTTAFTLVFVRDIFRSTQKDSSDTWNHLSTAICVSPPGQLHRECRKHCERDSLTVRVGKAGIDHLKCPFQLYILRFQT